MNNQQAFDSALLHLLNQGHPCVSSSGRVQLRSLRGGKSAIGALLPDRLYDASMEGKTVQQLLTASGREYDVLREHFAAVTPQLLNELQELHDRTKACMPSLFREIVIDGGRHIAQMFGLSMRMPHLRAAYQKLRGPYLPAPAPVPAIAPVPATATVTAPVAEAAATTAAEATLISPAPNPPAAPEPASVTAVDWESSLAQDLARWTEESRTRLRA
jgi:hypothetical protein